MHDPSESVPVSADATLSPSPPTAAADGAPGDAAEPAADDGTLDAYERDLDDVAAALEALDGDDLDTAESLAARLDEQG